MRQHGKLHCDLEIHPGQTVLRVLHRAGQDGGQGLQQIVFGLSGIQIAAVELQCLRDKLIPGAHIGSWQEAVRHLQHFLFDVETGPHLFLSPGHPYLPSL